RAGHPPGPLGPAVVAGHRGVERVDHLRPPEKEDICTFSALLRNKAQEGLIEQVTDSTGRTMGMVPVRGRGVPSAGSWLGAAVVSLALRPPRAGPSGTANPATAPAVRRRPTHRSPGRLLLRAWLGFLPNAVTPKGHVPDEGGAGPHHDGVPGHNSG